MSNPSVSPPGGAHLLSLVPSNEKFVIFKLLQNNQDGDVYFLYLVSCTILSPVQ